eukprot:ctg_5481.g839
MRPGRCDGRCPAWMSLMRCRSRCPSVVPLPAAAAAVAAASAPARRREHVPPWPPRTGRFCDRMRRANDRPLGTGSGWPDVAWPRACAAA